MSTKTDNPTEVLLTLDQELDHEVTLILYGRAALALGFANARSDFATTQDVDAIISFSQLPALMQDVQFWEALERTNVLLQAKGLYITHLFSEDQVFLRPEWGLFLVPVKSPATRFLKLFRPDAIDLILSKMMRGNDTQDMDDIAFLIRNGGVAREQMEDAFQTVRIPHVPELRDAFDRALPEVRRLLGNS